MEPEYIKLDNKDKDTPQLKELFGLANRSPERAMGYSWVDTETKKKSCDWANKRASQFDERRVQEGKTGDTLL
ncbi:hypothetical protein V8C42DRAFT_349408 [Trichoderma barbatum]